jgi:hypothetical protein
MAGLDPAIHVVPDRDTKDVDARDKPGHDELLFEAPDPNARLRPAARGARAFTITVRPENRGRGECRAPDAPAASCAHIGNKYAHEYSQRATGITRHSRTQWFTAYTRALPGDRLSCHRRRRSCLHRLDTSIGVSGPHVFAVRISVVRQRHCSVHRIPPRVRDDREAPL